MAYYKGFLLLALLVAVCIMFSDAASENETAKKHAETNGYGEDGEYGRGDRGEYGQGGEYGRGGRGEYGQGGEYGRGGRGEYGNGGRGGEYGHGGKGRRYPPAN